MHVGAPIRADYYVVSPHNIYARGQGPLAQFLIGPLVPCGAKGPDTLYPNGNAIIRSRAPQGALSLMWHRAPRGGPLP